MIREPRRGYGSAYLAGFAEARGEYIFMADADRTYDFDEIPNFLARLEDGADMVIGDRMSNIQPGAMHWLNRKVGNPLLSGVLNLFFHTNVRDVHCGMRAFRRDCLDRLRLQTHGMEFASEMVVRAKDEDLTVDQLTINYYPRGGESKLLRVRDGWRHLRYLLLHSPNHLFIAPGAVLAAIGAAISLMVLTKVEVLGRPWTLHTLIAGSLFVIVGTQLVGLGLCAHASPYFTGTRDPWFDRARERLRLEHGLVLGGLIAFAGMVMIAVIVIIWAVDGLGSLGQQRVAVCAGTLLVVGIQVVFASFLLSILGLRRGAYAERGASAPALD